LYCESTSGIIVDISHTLNETEWWIKQYHYWDSINPPGYVLQYATNDTVHRLSRADTIHLGEPTPGLNKLVLFVKNDCDVIDSVVKEYTYKTDPIADFTLTKINGDCEGMGVVIADGSTSSTVGWHMWSV